MKTEIINCFVKYANQIAQPVQYVTWSDNFCREETKSLTMDFLSELRKYIDFSNLTKKEALELGFGLWDDNLYLIPLYLLPIIPLGTELRSINGRTVKYNGLNVDNEVRCGCIAWGINIEKED